ncbi:hypothetical protein [Sinomonas mesophila]|uniref:restriction system modified-DNA reader domain-containing protein n=1 Tax=Sinomonas mesophila TaxID=1531955 RepID=UPI001C37C125|nr:hypothetical protein [Sinomonas mesophila]
MTLVEWNDNIAISDAAPRIYWKAQLESKKYLTAERLERQLELHALPAEWTDMEFTDFLTLRRKLMASVVREAFQRLSDPSYSAVYPTTQEPLSLAATTAPEDSETPSPVSVRQLVESGLLPIGTVLTPARGGIDALGEIDESGSIVVEGIPYPTPSAAAVAAAGSRAENGWTFWVADTPAGERRLDRLREQFRLDNVADDVGGVPVG